MKTNLRSFRLSLVFSACILLFTSCEKDQLLIPDTDQPLEARAPGGKRISFFGLSTANEIVRFTTGNSASDQGAFPILGLQAGEQILAIDFRPSTGQLYGISNQSRLYAINTNTGNAVPLSVTPFSPDLNGSMPGFDFNPTVDRIRLVTENGQNLRLHPETGLVAAVDGNINPGDKEISAAAYTNSFAGANSTTLYTIDFTAGKLFRQNPPNNGTQEEVGSLNIELTGNGGFDISPDNAVALAVINGGNDEGFDGNGKKSNFYYINLLTGNAMPAGVTKRNIIGVAIPTQPVAYAVDPDNSLLIFNPQQMSSIISKPITGLQPGENVLGIDMRPATGQLYALGSSSRVYTINMSNGAATAVGATSFSQSLNGSWFGFDFNPTVDRIRIVSNTGQNLRVHPVTGAVAFVDGALNPGSPAIDAAAYTNNFAGATTTTLFVIDYLANSLYTQVPPNNGTLNLVSTLSLDIHQGNGFDIGGTSGSAMGIFSTQETTYLCSVNLQTGDISPVSVFPDDVRGFTLGLGF